MRTLLLATTLLGCSNLPNPANIAGSGTMFVTAQVNLDRHLTGGIIDAVKAYCQQGIACIDLRFGNGPFEFRMVDSPSAMPPSSRRCRTDPNTVACAHGFDVYFMSHDGKGRRLRYDQPCDGRLNLDAYWVAAHEIGHWLGYDHSSDPDAVMYARTGCDRGAYLPGLGR